MTDFIITIATVIGFVVITASTFAGISFILYFAVNYTFKKFIDVKSFIAVMREAKRQGHSVFKEKNDDE